MSRVTSFVAISAASHMCSLKIRTMERHPRCYGQPEPAARMKRRSVDGSIRYAALMSIVAGSVHSK